MNMKSKYLLAAAVIVVVLAGGGYWWWTMSAPAAKPGPAPQPVPAAVQPNVPAAPVPAAAQPPAAANKVVLAEDPKLGKYLTDNNGRALYAFAKEVGGQTACAGKCLDVWPVFYLATVDIGPGMDAPDFTTITRPDGAKQTSYYGWPLYYYAGDAAAGDVKGEGFNKLWFVAKPDYTVVFANKDNVNFLVDSDTNHTLYRFSKDSPDVSTCAGVCAQNWPAFYVDKIVAPSFIDAARLGSFVRPDKAGQTTFDRLPLYHFVQDKAPGDLTGQGVNGFWSTVDPLAPPAP